MRRNVIAAILCTSIFALGSLAEAAETYEVDPVHSQILFNVRHLGSGQVWGWFKKFGGRIVFDPWDP